MIRTILIDDQKKSRRVLEQLLVNHFKEDIEIVGTAESAHEGIELINELKPDLLFLDVEMPYMSGFEMLQQLHDINFDIIFVTAHDHYAIKAIKFSALDYLLKPVDLDELRSAISKLLGKKKEPTANSQLDVFFQHLKNNQPTNKIALTTNSGMSFVEIGDIIRCEASSNYTVCHLTDGKKITTSHTLKNAEQLLYEFGFFRVHRSHLINMKHIKQFVKADFGTIIMDDGTEVEISRGAKEEFLKKFPSI